LIGLVTYRNVWYTLCTAQAKENDLPAGVNHQHSAIKLGDETVLFTSEVNLLLQIKKSAGACKGFIYLLGATIDKHQFKLGNDTLPVILLSDFALTKRCFRWYR